MKYTAKELFPSWYNKGVNKDASTDELALRRKTLDDISKKNDKKFWIAALHVFLGVLKPDDAGYDNVVSIVKGDDINFLLQDQNLIRVILGCAIAEKIDANSNFISDFLALSLVSVAGIGSYQIPLPEINTRAQQFIVDEAERQRDIVQISLTAPAKPVAKIEIPQFNNENSTAFTSAIVKAFADIQKDIVVVNADLIATKNQLSAAVSNFSSLSEETNILWWLFKSYSRTVDAPFAECTIALLSIVTAFELADLTETLPTIGDTDSIVAKALSSIPHEFGSLSTHDAIIEGILPKHERLKHVLPTVDAELIPLTPLLYAIKCRVEYGDAEWKAVYSRHCIATLSQTSTHERFASMLYNELMLIRSFDSIK